MLDHEQRIAALEKDAATMKRDIIYKLDGTNSAITIIKGVVGNVGNDVRIINMRLDGIDTRLARLEEQQNEQGQDIKDIKRSQDDLGQRFTSLEGKFEQMLQLLTTLTNKAE
jgi:chromosome segregation ATPase